MIHGSAWSNEPDQVFTFPYQAIGKQLLFWHEATSTNDLASSYAEYNNDRHTAFGAALQTAGRGQYGRTWTSRPWASLLMSVLLPWASGTVRPVIMNAWAACSLAQVLEDITSQQVEFKWPNDLLIRRQKICGILVEQQRALVLGFGINLTQTRHELDAIGLTSATSISCVLQDSLCPLPCPTVFEMAEAVLAELDRRFVRYRLAEQSNQPDPACEQDWRSRLAIEGTTAKITTYQGDELQGEVQNFTFEAITLALPRGEIVTLRTDSIRALQRLEGI